MIYGTLNPSFKEIVAGGDINNFPTMFSACLAFFLMWVFSGALIFEWLRVLAAFDWVLNPWRKVMDLWRGASTGGTARLAPNRGMMANGLRSGTTGIKLKPGQLLRCRIEVLNEK